MVLVAQAPAEQNVFIDLSKAVVVVRPADRPAAEQMAETILVDEVARRTGIRLTTLSTWPDDVPTVVALTIRNAASPWSGRIPPSAQPATHEAKPEGFVATAWTTQGASPQTVVSIVGTDARGTMFGVGRLLRNLRMKKDSVSLPTSFRAATAPAFPIRGHQIGYRATANAYDAWTPRQYEQYIRDLIVFGANAIENIPSQDERKNPLMKVSRQEMNRTLSELCLRYDIDYWVWTPADFPLSDLARRQKAIQEHEDLYRLSPRLDGVFFPGGDPGDNPVERVMPYLKDLSAVLSKHHPKAGIWISLQGFDRKKVDAFYDILDREKPTWLAGVVSGPSSPSISQTRARLPKAYRLRWYPDITHTVRCQFPVDNWDTAYALTLGREPATPRPRAYTDIFRLFANCTDGFLSYSDGINDDLNKALWSCLAWNPDLDIRDMLTEYARFFFGLDEQRTQDSADALLALENNWVGPLALNGAVNATRSWWLRLDDAVGKTDRPWRFELHLMRACYDAYTRARLIHETELERQAMEALDDAPRIGAHAAMDRALQVLRRADIPFESKQLQRIEALADSLFKSIGYQTSVKRYHASGSERGAVMDFIQHPLNNRWWLEDEFARIRGLPDEAAKIEQLRVIRTWEVPGTGSFYDDIGHVGKMPHVVWGEGINTDPEVERHDTADHAWWDNGMNRSRLSWLTCLRWPVGLRYEGLDRNARYTIRLTGRGDVRLRADGVLLTPTKYSKKIGEFKEFDVPPEKVADGQLLLTFDPIDEDHLNWRQQSNLAEAWLLKR